MRAEIKHNLYKWPKMVVRKWLNMKSGTHQFHSDYDTKVFLRRRRKSCPGDGHRAVVPEELSEELLMETNNEIERPRFDHPVSSSLNLRMFVGTWNVAGKTPQDNLNLSEWLKTKASSADIYVLGFQEIVPLNAGNVLGPEDCGPASKWLSLIRKSLNCDSNNSKISKVKRHKYCLAASRQMVGILLCVWVREDLIPHISSLKVSCVGTGIMGCLGNKGSVSVSMKLHRTTFCFVCTHLASGEKEGDGVRRNLDVAEIFRRTKFPRHSCTQPDTILSHDKIIWLGDLNYRLASINDDTYELLERNDWQLLLEQDQLRREQKAGRVFKGWEEGEIYFAPTYKYLTNSDNYAVQTTMPKEKRRTPAWCDRILWKGKGMKQMSYTRGESRFSDHRPVNSLFSVQLSQE